MVLDLEELKYFVDYIRKINKKYGVEICKINIGTKGFCSEIFLEKGLAKLAKVLGVEIDNSNFVDCRYVNFEFKNFRFYQDKKTYLQEIGELDKIIERWLPNGN